MFGIRNDPAYTGSLSKTKGLRTLINKTKEWITAVKLERAYTKKEIITMYFNTVDFGSNSFGIKAAANTFFNKKPGDLNETEAAILVGLLQAPSKYNPQRNPKNAMERRAVVLSQMKKYKLLDPVAYDTLVEKPLGLNYEVENHTQGLATYFRGVLQRRLLTWSREKGYDLYADGLKIYTTIDSRMQQHAEDAVAKHMASQQKIFDRGWGKKNPWVNSEFKEIPDYIENIARRTDIYRRYLSEYNGDEKKAMKALAKPVEMQVFDWTTPDYTRDTTMSVLDSIRHMKRFVQTGMMSMNPKTGHIKAWVGGINYKFFKYDHVRQSRRQPGSTFKPFLYAAAIDNGYTPCSQVTDSPVSFYIDKGNGETELWQPQNFENKYSYEQLTLRQALARSINSIAAFLIQRLGPQTMVDYAHRIGVQSELDPVPALSLGVSDVSVYEMVGAYSTFANNGVWTEPFYLERIEDKYGSVIQQYNPKRVEALSPETAYTMLYMLQGATKEKGGTALGLYGRSRTLTNGNEVAAKTGTTSNYSDGWFMGITKDLVTGVWVGGDDPGIRYPNSSLGQGARMAMPVWYFYMDDIYDDKKLSYTKGPFTKPGGIDFNFNCNEINRIQSDSTGRPANDDPEIYTAPNEPVLGPNGNI